MTTSTTTGLKEKNMVVNNPPSTNFTFFQRKNVSFDFLKKLAYVRNFSGSTGEAWEEK